MGRSRSSKVMASRTIQVGPERVFAELSDAWMFTGWVVGATHIRRVEGDWPQVGARIHHTIGLWPITLQDSTEVVAVDPPRHLLLNAHIKWMGDTMVELFVRPDPAGSLVTMVEWFSQGAGRTLQNPLQDAALRARNRESLARLASIAQNRPL